MIPKVNNNYPFSVFYFTKSVFDGIGNQTNSAITLGLRSVLINSRFKEKIGMNITYTTQDIINDVKNEDYIGCFKGLLQLGEDLAFAEDDTEVRGDKNFKLVQFAINKDGDILGIVKIVADDYETRQALNKIIKEEHYPIGVVNSEEALQEIQIIEGNLLKIFPN